MIKLKKTDEPNILKLNKEEWTRQYVDLVNRALEIPTSLRNKYKLPEIKQQIVKETNNKCAYCESIVSHVCPGDVEHILPKAKGKRPDLYVEWTNLTLSCEECNRTRKKDYYNPQDPLVNPYIDDPENHLMAVGPFIYHVPGDRKGELTELLLELNTRTSLVDKRLDRLKSIRMLADKWASEPDGTTLKELLEKQLLIETKSETEYSCIVKNYLKTIGLNTRQTAS